MTNAILYFSSLPNSQFPSTSWTRPHESKTYILGREGQVRGPLTTIVRVWLTGAKGLVQSHLEIWKSKVSLGSEPQNIPLYTAMMTITLSGQSGGHFTQKEYMTMHHFSAISGRKFLIKLDSPYFSSICIFLTVINRCALTKHIA